MELVSVTKVIQHLEDGYDSPTVLSGISADLLKKASKKDVVYKTLPHGYFGSLSSSDSTTLSSNTFEELGQYILKTDRGFKLLEDLLYAVQTLVKHDSNTFQCIADVGLIGLIADIFQDVIDRLAKDGMIEDLQVIIETLLETANVLGDLDSSAKSQVCQGLCPFMLELLQAKRLDFQVKMEVVKSTNMLLDLCPSAIKESIVQSGAFQGKIKELIQLIKSIGDYEFQVGLVECLIRLFPRKLRQNYATKFIDDNTIRDGFLSIKDREFETDCRIFLNDLNAGMVGSKSIYSIPCVAAFVGNKQLRKPSDTGYDQFWVDFNIGSQRMTLFCEQDSLLSQNSQMDEQLWETVAIYKTDILKCSCCEIQGAIILEVNLKQRVCELYPSQHQDVKDNTVRIEFELEREAEIATAVGKTFSFSEIRNKVSTVVNPIQISIKEVQEQDSQSQLQESEDPEMPYQTNMVPPASQDTSLKKRKVSVPSVPMRTPISTPVIPVEKNMSVISNSSISTSVNIKKVSEQLQRVSSASIPVRLSTKDNLESENKSNKDLKPKQDVRENKKQPAKPKESNAPKTPVTKSSISRSKVKTPVVTVTVASSKKTRGKKTAKDAEVNDRIRATEENLNNSDLADPESIPDSAPPVDLVEITVPKNKHDKKKTSDDSGINLDETSASSINNTSVVNISTSGTNRKTCQTKELDTDTAVTGSSKEKKSSNSQCEKKKRQGKDNKPTLKETNSKDIVQLNDPSGNTEAKRNTHNRPVRENDDDDDKFDFNSQEDKIPDSLEPLGEPNIQPKHAITDTNQSKCSIADKYSAILNAKGSKKKPKESKLTVEATDNKSKTNLKTVTEVEQISNVCKSNKSFADLEPSLKELCSIEDTNKANQNKKPSLEKKIGKTLAGNKIKIKEDQKMSKVNKEKKVSKKDKSISENNLHENHEVKKDTKRELRSRGKNRSYKEVDSSELSDNSADPDVSNKVGIKRNDTETATDPKQSLGSKTDNIVNNELPTKHVKKSVIRTENDKNIEELEQDNSDESSINNSDMKSSPEHNPDSTTSHVENVDISDRSSDISEDYRFNNSQNSQDLSQLGGMGTVESPDTELVKANTANHTTSKKDMSAVNFVTGKSKGKSSHSKANSKSCKEKNVYEKETDDIIAESESENNSIEKTPEVDKKSSNAESKTETKKYKVKKPMTDNAGENINESENSTNNDSNELEIVKSNVKKESSKKKPKNKTKDLSFTSEQRNIEQMEFQDGGKGKFKQHNINSMSKSKGKGFVFQMSYCKSETNYKYNKNRILTGLNSPEKSIGYDPYDFGSQCQNEVDNVNMQVGSKTSRKARKFFKHSRKDEILEEKYDKNENNKKNSKTGKLGTKDDKDSFSELRIDLDDSLIKSLTSPKGKYAGRHCSNKENECVKMKTKTIPADNIDMVDLSDRSTKGKNKQKKYTNNRSKQSNEDMTCDTMAVDSSDSLLQSSPEMESFQTKDDSKTKKRKQKSRATKGEEGNDTYLDSDTKTHTHTLKKGRQSSRKHQNSNSENNNLQNTNTSQFKSETSKRKDVDKRTKCKSVKNQTKGLIESTIDIDSGDSLVISPEHPKSQRLLEQDPVTKKWYRKSDLKDNLKSKSNKNKNHVGNRRSDKMDMRENNRQDIEEELEEKTPSDVEMPEIPQPGPVGPENDEASDEEENRFSKIIKDIVSSRAGTKHNQSKHKSPEKHSKRKSQSSRKTESEEEDYSKNENEVSFKEFDSEIIDCVMEEIKTPCISASVASTPRVGSARQKHYNPLNISVIKTPNSLSKSVTFHADARDKGSDTESSSEEDRRKQRRQKTRRKKKSVQYKDLSDEEIDREDSFSQSSSRKSISSLLDSSNNISTRSEKSWILERKKTPKPKPKTYKREHRKQPELCQSQTDSSDENEDDNKSTASRSLSMRSGILSLDFPTPSLSSLYKQNRRGDDEENLILTPITPLKLPNSQHKSGILSLDFPTPSLSSLYKQNRRGDDEENLILTPITPLKLPNSQHKSEDDIEVYQTQENCTVSLNMDKRHLEGEDMDVGDIGSICLSALGVKTPNRYSQDKAVRDADEEISESTTKKLKASLKTFLGDSGFASGPSSEVRSSRSALKRKYPNLAECESASAASSDEESENEMERSTLVPKKLFKFDHSSILKTMRAQSDTASTCSDTMDDPEQIDYPVQSGITSFISAFGADIQKHLNVKKQKFETLTKNVLKVTQKQFSRGWMEQQQYQSNVTDDFQAKMMAELSLLEADIAKMKESEIKSEEFFRGQLETLHNNYLSQRNRLDNLKKMQTSYKDRCRKLQTYNSTNHKTMMDQLRHEMSHLQKKLIEQTQKQEMMNVKRGLQNLF